ncbi:MAG: AMP-binding protein [Firmicutes bacterium]|nr:AMP-binding protein [Bacillota bacterium]
MNAHEKLLKKIYSTRTINNFRQLIYGSAEKHRKDNAFILKDRNISYWEFKRDYQSLCTRLLTLDYADKRIAVIGGNSYEWIISYLSAATIGVVVPIDKELCPQDIADFVESGDCSAVIADKDILDNISPLLKKKIEMYNLDADNDSSVHHLIQEGSLLYSSGSCEIDTMAIDENRMSILIFTSGTTGNSKGVCLSQKNICVNIRSIAQMVKVDRTRHSLSILPLHHTYEATIGHLLLLSAGGKISYCDGLKFIARNIEEYKPSVIIAVPRLLDVMLNKIEKSVRGSLPDKYLKNSNDITFNELLCKLPFYIKFIVKRKVKASLGGKLDMLIVGAAATKPEVVKAFCQLGIKTYQGYGLTECAPLLAGNNDFFINPYSAGLPIPGVEIKIYDPNTDGIGEIIAKGDNIMLGYYKDPDATAEVMKDGFFHTGDLGKMDEDGFVYITGRKKNVIVMENGKNIYPEELEEKLAEEAVVAEALILGVFDKRGNTAVKAKIFPNLNFIIDYLHNNMPSKEDVHNVVQAAVERVNEKLPAYKKIHVVEVLWSELEKTTTQKIKRYGTNYAI